MVFHFTDQNFKQEAFTGFVIIDMYAEWCGPCKMLAPIFEEVAKQFAGKVKMGKLNVDESPETPGSFGISSIPAIIFLKDGKNVGQLVGFQPKEVLIQKTSEIFGVI